MGGYHTIDLELNKQFSLEKEEWDVISLDRIKESCDIANKADTAAIVMEEGLAHVCLLTDTMTLVRQKIEKNVPKKGRGTTRLHDTGVLKFFDQVYQALVMHVDFLLVKAIIIASPGFVKVSSNLTLSILISTRMTFLYT